jgi:hypothetical protein
MVVIRRARRLCLPHHSKEAISRSRRRRRRRRTMGIHHLRHPLFVIDVGIKSIVLSSVGTLRYAHSMGRKSIVYHLVGRTKPHARS